MKNRVNVIGVGMTKFAKPGASDDYHVMAAAAGRLALNDAGIRYDEIEQAYTGYVYGDPDTTRWNRWSSCCSR